MVCIPYGAFEQRVHDASGPVDIRCRQHRRPRHGSRRACRTGRHHGAVPEVGAAVASTPPLPVLSAGGIVTGRQMASAMWPGAACAWTGSVWLTTEEAETAPVPVAKMLAGSSGNTARATRRSGKPAWQLTSDWIHAWEPGVGPGSLPMPLQSKPVETVLPTYRRTCRGQAPRRESSPHLFRQPKDLMTKMRPAHKGVYDFAVDYLDTEPPRRTSTLELGKTPTTSVRRLTSLLSETASPTKSSASSTPSAAFVGTSRGPRVMRDGERPARL